MLSLTYLSSVGQLLTREELVRSLARWRPRNAGRDVTGVLLYSGGNVLQTLEGDPEVVEGLFATIAADPRHHDVTVVLRRPIEARIFRDWSMGFRDVLRAPSAPGAGDAAPDEEAVEGLVDHLSRRPGADGPEGTSADDAVLLLMDIFRASTR